MTEEAKPDSDNIPSITPISQSTYNESQQRVKFDDDIAHDVIPEDETVTKTNVSTPDLAEDEVPKPPARHTQKNRHRMMSSMEDGSMHALDLDAIDASTMEIKTKIKKNKQLPYIPAAAPTCPSDRCDNDDNNTDPAFSADRIKLGVCAMDKKARSRPMAEILSRLDEHLFQVVFFGDDVILHQPVEDWPVCQILIAFFSKGYPLPKAQEYVNLRKPFILNDLGMQELMQDRRRVYDLLQASGIDVPRHVYLSRDGYLASGKGDGNGARDQEVHEFDDHIEVNGVTIHKPFVEKPVNAEDHNIAIYYPTSAGGGCKKLFRKIGNRSSEFYPDINEVRRDGSYIYEEFVETQGTDVKMYTVGPDYGHAEARKSPTVDGKVERNSEGKEVRFPVILTFREKEIARRIVVVFKQFVCGFDILRVQEGRAVVSYVCDVNGWSFVKNSRKYYDDCAQILTEHILAIVKPAALKTFSTLDPLLMSSMNRMDDELSNEIAGDSKKRSNTFLSRATRMLQGEPADGDTEDDDLTVLSSGNAPSSGGGNGGNGGSVHGNGGGNGNGGIGGNNVLDKTGTSPARSETGELLSNAAATLVEGAKPVREFPANLTSEPASIAQSAASSVAEEDGTSFRRRRSSSLQGSHQEELRCVLAIIRHGDRTPKQKLKLVMSEPHILKYFHDHVEDCRKDLKVKAKAPLTKFLQTVKTTLSDHKDSNSSEHQLLQQLQHMRDILERWKIVGLNRKLQIKPKAFEEYTDDNGETQSRCTEVQLVLKWGGNLTKLGEKQAMNLGRRLRTKLYPDAPGGGILRLHSTFRHDLKIKTSDEGRVMKTAAAFAKGLLELEGDLPPILVSLVHKEKGSMHMLDPSGNKDVKKELDECKEKITANLQKDVDVGTADEPCLEQLVGPPQIYSLREALKKLENPRKTLFKIHSIMGELIGELEEMLGAMETGDEKQIEGGEGLEGEKEADYALSGVKLYKGETLLELTERWRFIYNRLYDADTDRFDLSRVPDVHDNVRFDVLHNPHLGLTSTLERLYEHAKLMADVVVPQEYGTTIAEKRSVGVKVCRGLLEKVKYDVNVARTDNEVDMRYLINMDYSSDIAVNTMGRRVRTRLYFTSESHLHTTLNVLRFASADAGAKSLLSKEGTRIVNETPELCYLTQIVFRVFEDNRREMDDPRRFRVEILFSPGATATPLHVDENERGNDASRFDSEPLQMIGREGLTCQEVEDFFEQAIRAGRSDEDDSDEEDNDLSEPERTKKGFRRKGKDKPVEGKLQKPRATRDSDSTPLDDTGHRGISIEDLTALAAEAGDTVKTPPSDAASRLDGARSVHDAPDTATDVTDVDTASAEGALRGSHDGATGGEYPDNTDPPARVVIDGTPSQDAEDGDTDDLNLPRRDNHDDGNDDDIDSHTEADYSWTSEQSRKERLARLVARKYFWTTVAVGSFVVGAGCLLLALSLSQDSRRHRRWSTRRY